MRRALPALLALAAAPAAAPAGAQPAIVSPAPEAVLMSRYCGKGRRACATLTGAQVALNWQFMLA